MSKFPFGRISEKNLIGVHPDLVKLARAVAEHVNCSVTDGARSIEEQRLNIAKGVSSTMNSKHLPRNAAGELDETGLAWAIDLIPYPIDWGAIERGLKAMRKVDPELETARAYAFVGFVLGTAAQLGIDVRPGADWDEDFKFGDHGFIDLPHFEKEEP